MIRSLTLSRRHWMAGALALAAAFPALAQSVDINGLYTAQGRNPDGSVYDGQAVVAEVNGAVQINWTVGNQSYSGNGVREGQVVVINWGQTDPVVYVVMANGEMHGTWAGGTALEKLVRK